MAIATTLSYEDLPALLTRLIGDEKHNPSSYSTLDVLWVLYDRVLDRDDRFILSKGHGPAAYYAVLAAKGLLPAELLDGFGDFDSPLGHHPDRKLVPGAEFSSGSLGHGLAVAVGSALTGRRVFCLVGDAELEEGSNWEAVQYAGTHRARLADGDRDRQRLVLARMAGRRRAPLHARRLGGAARRRARPRAARGRADARSRGHATALHRRGGGGEMTTMRQRFYDLTRTALEEDERVAVVTAQIGTDSIGEHPRHFDVGIREQLMIGVAAGLALEGYRPIAHSYTPFLVERPYEMLKLDLGHNDLGAVLVSIGASYDAAPEGRTHQAPEDVALVAALPGWTIHVPGHVDEADRLFRQALGGDGRTYLRLSEETNHARVDGGWLTVLRHGSAGAPLVVAVGPTLTPVLEATADRDVTRRVHRNRAPIPARRGARRARDRDRRRPRRAVSRRHVGARDQRRAARPAAPAARAGRPEQGVPPLRHRSGSIALRTGSTPPGLRARSRSFFGRVAQPRSSAKSQPRTVPGSSRTSTVSAAETDSTYAGPPSGPR